MKPVTHSERVVRVVSCVGRARVVHPSRPSTSRAMPTARTDPNLVTHPPIPCSVRRAVSRALCFRVLGVCRLALRVRPDR